MFFSLIIGTLNRHKELEICLDSLLEQTYNRFEVIIIDQSANINTEELVNKKKYNKLNINYFKVNFVGLSKARNYGLLKASGDYFVLIDDDAAYSKDYLWIARQYLLNSKKTILSGHMILPNGLPAFSNKYKTKVLSIRDIVRNAPSPGLVFPMDIVYKGILFDEELGVGARYGAGEETDFILSSLDKGYRVVYLKNMVFKHPTIEKSAEIAHSVKIKKIENYARGLGALLVKDKILRGSNRLIYFEIEKKIKLLIKRLGILGKEKRVEAIAESRGMQLGIEEYRNSLNKKE